MEVAPALCTVELFKDTAWHSTLRPLSIWYWVSQLGGQLPNLVSQEFLLKTAVKLRCPCPICAAEELLSPRSNFIIIEPLPTSRALLKPRICLLTGHFQSMGTRSKRKASLSVPPSPHSKAIYLPKVTRSMTPRKMSGASPPVSDANTMTLSTGPCMPSTWNSSAPPATKSNMALLPLNAATPSVPSSEDQANPPCSSDIKGKGKAVDAVDSLESSSYIVPLPHETVDLSYDLANPTSCMTKGQPVASSPLANMPIPLISSTPSLCSLVHDRSSSPSFLLGVELENLFIGVAQVLGIYVEPLQVLVQQLPNLCMKELIIEATDLKKMGLGLKAIFTILSALSELRGIPPWQAFCPNYAFVRTLKGDASPLCVELMWETLVQRLLHSHENIEAQLRTLYHFFTEPDARLSQISFDSTEGELHLVYGTQSPRTELAHFWRNEEKRNKLPSHLKINMDHLTASLLADGYSVPSYRIDSTCAVASTSSQPALSKQIQFKEMPDIVWGAIVMIWVLEQRPSASSSGAPSSCCAAKASPQQLKAATMIPLIPPGVHQEAGGAGDPSDNGSDRSRGDPSRRDRP
ncbi:hypothetical protein BDN71DRAFT_1434638 [Pleurotus eryngii]|uniref:Uncharacterized protein n=1 Tax=Pleurotus eryngii TaxID=5323 RepID=A0A9P5ZRM2_PLEER|nr:hypothetical protein BDN71DRAFT_1434638 [Pleurotus eryngii]